MASRMGRKHTREASAHDGRLFNLYGSFQFLFLTSVTKTTNRRQAPRRSCWPCDQGGNTAESGVPQHGTLEPCHAVGALPEKSTLHK